MKLLRRIRAVLVLAVVFLWELVAASFSVARIVLSPRIVTSPAIIRVPVELERSWTVALAAYFTSLTPGSTCLHVTEDRRHLYIHLLHTADAEASVAHFKRHFERWLRELEA
jgi:multisubunit Na+/H+ antiporter MnhE subunit